MASKEEQADVQCPTCGQKYTVYYSRQSKIEREEALESVRVALLEHHVAAGSASAAHPEEAFNVPKWNGPAHMSGAALLSGAPVVRRVPRSAPVRLVS